MNSRTLLGLVVAGLAGCGGGSDSDAGTPLVCATCTTQGGGTSAGAPATAAPVPTQPGATDPTAPPPGAQARATPEGYWVGAGGGYTIATLVLGDGRLFSFYSVGSLIYGVVAGSLTSSAGAFTGRVTDYNARMLAVTPGTVAGTFSPMASLAGQVQVGAIGFGFTGTYDPSYDLPTPMTKVAGTWRGSAGNRHGDTTATLSALADGTFTGATPFCGLSGSFGAIDTAKAPMAVTVRFSGAGCPIAGVTMTGVAVHAEAQGRQRLVAVGLLPNGNDGFFLLADR